MNGKARKVVSMIAGLMVASSLTTGVTANSNVSIEGDHTYFIPAGLGSLHTYTIWDKVRWGYACRDTINAMNGNIRDSYGIVRYGDTFAAALTDAYGNVGDVMLVVNYDGIVYPVCKADSKTRAGVTGPSDFWGHQNGKDIVEFEVLSSCTWSLYHGSGTYVSDLMNKNIYKIINIGSVFDDATVVTDSVIHEKAREHGLGGYTMLTSPYGGYVI